MNVLQKIIETQKAEVAETKKLYPLELLQRSIYYATETVSLKSYLKKNEACPIIAEIKKQSPSYGVINKYIDVEKLSIGYMQAGAAAISVLTDKTYFGGSNEDLMTARKFNYCPILRKEFIVDEYQIMEAKSIGADAILLIAACLSETQIQEYTQLAKSLGLEVLLELHDEEEISKIDKNVDILGVNNRSLKTMKIDLQHSIDLYEQLPKDQMKISESGIESPESIVKLMDVGYEGFLIGSHFMKQAEPQLACKQFIQQVLKQKNKSYAY